MRVAASQPETKLDITMKLLKHSGFLTLLLIVVTGAVLFAFLPKPVEMNLDKVGNGQRSAVFIYDLNLAFSNPQVVEIDKAKDSLGTKVNFMVAKVGDPNSAEFRQRYGAQRGEILFFDAKGALADRTMALVNAETLVSVLNQID